MKNGRTRKVGAPVFYVQEGRAKSGEWKREREWEREWEREFERRCGRRKVGGGGSGSGSLSEGAEDGRSAGKRALRVVGGADPYGWGAGGGCVDGKKIKRNNRYKTIPCGLWLRFICRGRRPRRPERFVFRPTTRTGRGRNLSEGAKTEGRCERACTPHPPRSGPPSPAGEGKGVERTLICWRKVGGERACGSSGA